MHWTYHLHMLIESSNGNVDDDLTDYNPLLLKSIENDVDAARTHLNNHVTSFQQNNQET
jgi:hypothetical protein